MPDAVGLREEANFPPLFKQSPGLMEAPNAAIPAFFQQGGHSCIEDARHHPGSV